MVGGALAGTADGILQYSNTNTMQKVPPSLKCPALNPDAFLEASSSVLTTPLLEEVFNVPLVGHIFLCVGHPCRQLHPNPHSRNLCLSSPGRGNTLQ